MTYRSDTAESSTMTNVVSLGFAANWLRLTTIGAQMSIALHKQKSMRLVLGCVLLLQCVWATNTGACSGCCATSGGLLEGWCEFDVVTDGTQRLIVSNGIPTHRYSTLEATAASSGYDTTNDTNTRLCEQMKTITLPIHSGGANAADASPAAAGLTVAATGPVGYLVSCGYLYNHLSRPEGHNNPELTDNCLGYVDSDCRYHYFNTAECIGGFSDSNSGELVGYLFDGYEVRGYSQCGDRRCRSCMKQQVGTTGHNVSHYNFLAGSDCDLDEANGHVIQEDGEWKYVYVITDNYPFVVPALRGDISELTDYTGTYTAGPSKGQHSQCTDPSSNTQSGLRRNSKTQMPAL